MDFQPYFQIKGVTTRNVYITPGIVMSMVDVARFDLETIEIEIPLQLRPTRIDLCLFEEGTRQEQLVPISGFPRALIFEEALQRNGMQ